MNRRNYLFLSTGAAIGSLFVGGDAAAGQAATDDGSASGLLTGRPKPLRHTAVPGFLSAGQIAPHHSAHYGGALKAFRDVEATFEAGFGAGEPVAGPRFDRMQQLQSSRGNSVLLHELYFDGLALEAPDPPADIRRAIERRFGSMDRWADDFLHCAAVAAGWALLVHHPVNGKLYNVVSDEHAQGPLWMAAPLVVLDVYEHAFYIDYQNRKTAYTEAFPGFIDWNESARRLRGR